MGGSTDEWAGWVGGHHPRQGVAGSLQSEHLKVLTGIEDDKVQGKTWLCWWGQEVRKRDQGLKGPYMWERWCVVIGSCDPKALRMDGSDPSSTSRSHTDPEKGPLNK